MKTCRDCGEEKSEEDFHTYAGRDGVTRYREGQCKPCKNMTSRLRPYQLTRDEYEALVAAQGGICAICKDEAATHIDHCHRTGRVRALLCPNCNYLLGHSKENVDILLAARDFLLRHQQD